MNEVELNITLYEYDDKKNISKLDKLTINID